VGHPPTSFRDPLGLCPTEDSKTKAIESAVTSGVLDAVGIVPRLEAFRAAADVASDADSLYEGFEFASNLGSLGLTITEGNGAGAGLAVTATAITILKVTKGVAGVLPVAGGVVAAVSVLYDIYHGFQKYEECSSLGGE
jgi:hypothetical protein